MFYTEEREVTIRKQSKPHFLFSVVGERGTFAFVCHFVQAYSSTCILGPIFISLEMSSLAIFVITSTNILKEVPF